jgi:hypothetical protein
MGDGFEESQVTRLERTRGADTAWIIHIDLYAAHHV